MTTTAHALTGAMIATVIKKPRYAIPLAFLSHFVCDALPHFGLSISFGSLGMFAWLVIDGLVAIGFALFLIKKKVWNPVLLAICGFAAMSPDLTWLYYGLKGQGHNLAAFDPITHFHYIIQWSQTGWGIITDVSWATLMTYIILRMNNESHKNIPAS
jgi:hypothetical protein